MKTQKIISMETLTVSMLILILLLITSCGGKQGTLANEKSGSSVSQTIVKPPAMNIHTAAFMGNLKAVHQHVKAGSDLNAKDQYGSTPLIIAATFGKTEVATSFIKAGADVNLKNNDGSTPLHIAAFFCRMEIVKLLLEKGADKNLKNNYGSTALESVASPFNDVKGIYDQLSKELGPLGLKLDYKYIEKTRPVITEILQ